jgi:hypothetical protein
MTLLESCTSATAAGGGAFAVAMLDPNVEGSINDLIPIQSRA